MLETQALPVDVKCYFTVVLIYFFLMIMMSSNFSHDNWPFANYLLTP
jgi:hypothetical protein